MNPGFLLLGSHLGDPERKILTPAQIRVLTQRMGTVKEPPADGEVTEALLKSLGYGSELCSRILSLLEGKDQLAAYLEEGRHRGCYPLTRGEAAFPGLVRKRLGGECPACLFYKGDPEILRGPAISLVGSRDLKPENSLFAREAGRQAALHGVTLVSGNARGADRTAQQACLEAGGKVISVVADSLTDKLPRENLLYLSLEDFDAVFSGPRALSRNRVIHTLGYMTLVAQCSLGTGGTWSGTTKNLREGWSLVVCCKDGSEASLALQERGAWLMETSQLADLANIRDPQLSLFEEDTQ